MAASLLAELLLIAIHASMKPCCQGGSRGYLLLSGRGPTPPACGPGKLLRQLPLQLPSSSLAAQHPRVTAAAGTVPLDFTSVLLQFQHEGTYPKLSNQRYQRPKPLNRRGNNALASQAR